NRFHYEFRWFWDYAGGLMTDWGVHLIDMVLAGMKANLPVSVIANGGKLAFPGDARETPDTFSANYDFGNFQMTWEHNMATGLGLYGMQHGIAFIGDKGTLLLNRGGWEVRPDKQGETFKMEAVPWQKQIDNGLDLHTINFIDVVKSRKQETLNCDIREGGRVSIVSHMGNIAYRTGERIDIENHVHFFKQSAANKLVKPEYRNGWKMPKY
ncbi:MAG: Gfo/Idh/MocA family protein, partial [Flavisolibacter sp.]